MKVVKAILDKKRTDDGMFNISDNVPIGKVYSVDLDSIRMMKGKNVIHNTTWTREMINVIEDDSLYQEWMPTELLLILSE